MRNRRLTRAVERLADDPRFLARFREDPERALARYGLSPEEVEAVMTGDAHRLAANGVDVDGLAAARRRSLRSRVRRVLLTVAASLTAVPFIGVPAASARRIDAPRHGLARAAVRSERLSPRLRASGVRLGLGRALRAGRFTPGPGVRRGFERSGLRDGLRANGIRLSTKPPIEVDPVNEDAPFELGSDQQGAD